MHLLRWTAMRMALAAGAPSIDLGGVDVPGARRRPEPGDANWGLYEHKVGFGAGWVESAGAHEIVLRPSVYRIQGLLRTVRRRLLGLPARP
jgi:lipid II:glycine glycyltransferase (peptidoglycan interpeptide bridge formation enzyme)